MLRTPGWLDQATTVGGIENRWIIQGSPQGIHVLVMYRVEGVIAQSILRNPIGPSFVFDCAWIAHGCRLGKGLRPCRYRGSIHTGAMWNPLSTPTESPTFSSTD